MYSCLDWGLDADVERELDVTLEVLVGQMTKVDLRLDNERCLQCINSITEVLQVQTSCLWCFVGFLLNEVPLIYLKSSEPGLQRVLEQLLQSSMLGTNVQSYKRNNLE